MEGEQEKTDSDFHFGYGLGKVVNSIELHTIFAEPAHRAGGVKLDDRRRELDATVDGGSRRGDGEDPAQPLGNGRRSLTDPNTNGLASEDDDRAGDGDRIEPPENGPHRLARERRGDDLENERRRASAERHQPADPNGESDHGDDGGPLFARFAPLHRLPPSAARAAGPVTIAVN